MKHLKHLVAALTSSELRGLSRRLNAYNEEVKSDLIQLIRHMRRSHVQRISPIPSQRILRCRPILRKEVLDTLTSSYTKAKDDPNGFIVTSLVELVEAKILLARQYADCATPIIKSVKSLSYGSENYPIAMIAESMLTSTPNEAGANMKANSNLISTLESETILTKAQEFRSRGIKFQHPNAQGKSRVKNESTSNRLRKIESMIDMVLVNGDKIAHDTMAINITEDCTTNNIAAPASGIDFAFRIEQCVHKQKRSPAPTKEVHSIISELELRATFSINELYAVDALMHSALSQKHYLIASRISDAVQIPMRLKESTNYLNLKWQYYSAVTLFLKGDNRACLRTLRSMPSFKDGFIEWKLGCHYLELIAHIDRRNFEMAEVKVSSFSRMLARKRSEFNSSDFNRMRTIMVILRSLVKRNFNFQETVCANTKDIQTLINSPETHTWNIWGYEVVRFDLWFLDKAGVDRGEYVENQALSEAAES